MNLHRAARRLAKATLTGMALGPLSFGVVAPAWATGQFTVTPVRIFMVPKDRATAVTLTNEGDEELVMQADVYVWKQKPGGEDDLTLSEDLFLSPPIIKLAPKSRQVVRLAMVRPPQSAEQLTYRMIVREIPEARASDKEVQVQIALAFSMPIFITPPGAKSQLGCSAERAGPDAIRAVCENTGGAYTQVRELVLSSPTGDKWAGREIGAYILPSVKRAFDIRRADGPIPGGKAKLAVTLDDGSTRTFDVTVAE